MRFDLDDLRADILGQCATVDTPFGRRRVTYADYIASGRALGWVEERLRRTVLPRYANTHTEDSATGAATTALTHAAADYIKRCLGADERFCLIFAGTGATGALKRLQEILGVAVAPQQRERLLDALPPGQRPVVFVGPYEHHSNEVSWRESLAEVVEVPLDANGLLDLGGLERAMTDRRFGGRPLFASFSAASNVTGLLSDTRALARAAHRLGGKVFFDYAAAAPYVAIDVGSGGEEAPDALVLSPHKFVGGPGTPGLLLLRRDLYRGLRSPTTAGGGTVTYVDSTAHRFVDDIETREDAGTPAIVQKVRAALAFYVKERVGVARIEARERDLALRAVRRLRGVAGLELLGNLEAPRLAVVSFLVRGSRRFLHPRFVVRLLSDLFGIQGRAGCSCAGPYGHALLHIDAAASRSYLAAVEAGFEGIKPGWSRLSFHYLLDEAEFDFLLRAIEFVATYGERFLPLYRFDWRTGAWRHRDEAGGDTRLEGAFEPEEWAEPALAAGTEDERSAYLDEAARLAAALPVASAHEPGSAVPDGLDPSLVFFAV